MTSFSSDNGSSVIYEMEFSEFDSASVKRVSVGRWAPVRGKEIGFVSQDHFNRRD
jgi:hypothetical protein